MSTAAIPSDARERERLVDELLVEVRTRWPGVSLRRVVRGLQIWCYRKAAQPYPRQQALGFFVPGLPDKPWLDPYSLAFAQDIKEAYPDIRHEASQFIDRSVVPPPYGLSDDAPSDAQPRPGSPVGWLEWRLAAQGRMIASRCDLFPSTAAVVQNILRKTPFIMNAIFMILRPGSATKLHADYTNAFVNLWMGVFVPRDCGLEVAGELRRPEPGELLAFNHSYEHLSWNRDSVDRVVFSVSALHPDLTLEEQEIAAFLFPRLRSHIDKYAGLR